MARLDRRGGVCVTAPARGRRVGRPPLLVRRRVDLAPRALHQMNLQLHHVISDITRQTGLAFVDAMLAGEWDS